MNLLKELEDIKASFNKIEPTELNEKIDNFEMRLKKIENFLNDTLEYTAPKKMNRRK